MLNPGLPFHGADETSPGEYDNNAANDNTPDGRSYAARAITKDLVDRFKWLPSRPGQPTLNQLYAALLDCKADTGIPLVTQHNVNVVVALHPDLVAAVGLNEMSGQTGALRPLPWDQDATGRCWNDNDDTNLHAWLQSPSGGDIGKSTKAMATGAITNAATVNKFHPVQDYLRGLTWDGQERLSTLLQFYFGSDDSEYARAVSRFLLISMVARVMKPGCKADYMVVLEGNQGQGKSTACRILAGDWYSDSMPGDVSSKDAKAHLQGKWLIELAELHALNKSETTALKAFLTSATDKYRPTYGRNEVERPRQNVFIGTTNKQTYLRDETGSRRFWPIQTADIKRDQLQADRDQLFAEAYEAFKAGEAWWPTREFERDYILQEQEERADRDIWEQSVMGYIAQNNIAEVTIYDLAKNALFFDTSRMGTSD